MNPSEERTIKRRRAARVIVRARDADGRARVLLFADTDPGVAGSRWWVTPGGGMDPGESEPQTAVRELFEETGLVVAEADLQGPVARRVVVHGYSDQVLVQEETFFLVDTEQFEVDTSGFTDLERLTLLDHGWFFSDAPQARGAWPRQLPDLFDWAGEPLLDWGLMEESTVPVADPARLLDGARRE